MGNDILGYNNIIENYKSQYEYTIWYNNIKQNSIPEPIKDYKWELYKKNLEAAIDKLFNINNLKDLDKIQKNIKENQIEYNEYIESNHYKQYENLVKEITSNINILKSMPKKDLLLNEEISNEVERFQIMEEDIYSLYKLILQIHENLNYISLFKIEKININMNNNIYNSISKRIYSKQSSNFIFKKGNNSPTFLNKTMKINLGLYIIGYELKNIGTASIQNNYSGNLQYFLGILIK